MKSKEDELEKIFHVEAVELLVELGLAKEADVTAIREKYGPLSKDLLASRADGRAKVLVVDDNEAIRDLYKKILSTDYRVVVAASGPDAIRKIAENPDIKLMIIDLIMLGMNGVQFLKLIRTRRILEGIPTLIVSGEADKGTVADVVKLGISKFLVKPITKEQLEATARELIQVK